MKKSQSCLCNKSTVSSRNKKMCRLCKTKSCDQNNTHKLEIKPPAEPTDLRKPDMKKNMTRSESNGASVWRDELSQVYDLPLVPNAERNSGPGDEMEQEKPAHQELAEEGCQGPV